MKNLRAFLFALALVLLPVYGDLIAVLPVWLSVLSAAVLLILLGQGVGLNCDDTF